MSNPSINYDLTTNWYGLYNDEIQDVLSYFNTYTPSASNVADVSGTGTKSDPFILRQRNFAHGPFRILTPGYWKLGEHIIFNPNASISNSTAPV